MTLRRFLALLLPVAACGYAYAQPGAELPLQSISRGVSPAIRSSVVFVVARNSEQWAAGWQLPFTDSSGNVTQASRPLPAIDFQTSMVVGAVLASSSHGCTGVNIVRASVAEQQIVVLYRQRPKPRDNEICTASFTTAYHFAVVAASHLPVTFAEEKVPSNPSIEGTSNSGLRPLSAAPHVKR
jgi:hypothetical protein